MSVRKWVCARKIISVCVQRLYLYHRRSCRKIWCLHFDRFDLKTFVKSPTGSVFQIDSALTAKVLCLDLDLDPMTLIYELDLDVFNMHLHTKNEVFRSTLSKLEPERESYTQRHTDTHRCDRTHYTGK